MPTNVAVEIAKLQKMSTGQLRERFAAAFGKETKTGNKTYLVKKLIWKLQADESGGLSEKAQERAGQIVEVGGIGTRLATKVEEARPRDPRTPMAGTTLVKTWRGATYTILVGESDFEFAGKKWRSLSGIAREITKQSVNGFLWFDLLPKQLEAKAKREAKKAAKAEAAAMEAPPSPAAEPAQTETPAEPAAEKPVKKSRKAEGRKKAVK